VCRIRKNGEEKWRRKSYPKNNTRILNHKVIRTGGGDGDDTVISSINQGKVNINTGGGNDIISAASEASSTKINCGVDKIL